MRKIREILRLKYEQGLSHREIAQACAIGAGTVSRYLRKTTARGVGWPLPAELDDAALEADLFPRPAPVRNRALPDCAYIHRELKQNGVTLQLLWKEYAGVHPSGYRYTQFCEVYRQWAGRLRPSMRQVHRAGEKTFIDFSGKRPSLVDRRTGALRPVELFLAVLGASSLTYAEATETQQLPDWCDAHIHMVEYFGGSTTMWVPDQLRSAVTRPCRLRARRQSHLRGPGRPLRRRCRPGATAQAAGQGSGFILRTFLYMRCKFRISPPVSEPFSGMGDGQRSGGRLEEYRPFVVGTHGVQHAFLRESLGRAQMHVELRGPSAGRSANLRWSGAASSCRCRTTRAGCGRVWR